jgi:SAM-dependent methyltransferase
MTTAGVCQSSSYGDWYSGRNADEGERLDLFAEVFDAGTIPVLAGLGIQPGWRCADVGGGRGSIAAWIANRAYAGSTIVADLDPTLRSARVPSAVTYVRFDATKDELPPETFDLIHSRFLLQHLSPREEVLDLFVSALAPGGWLVVGDGFELATSSTIHPDFAASRRALYALLSSSSSTDHTWGRTYPDPLVRRGLIDICCNLFAPPLNGGDDPYARMLQISLQRLRATLVADGLQGLMIDPVLERLRDPGFHDFDIALVTACGRKPYPAASS